MNLYSIHTICNLTGTILSLSCLLTEEEIQEEWDAVKPAHNTVLKLWWWNANQYIKLTNNGR